ncbi:MAG: flavodoxin domain-containing protein [Streptococcaceae bacterium]|jgi:menaquinone-dependent protoporphyrinogen IX oxidase|nr:flavodoxin domain-containing protein [Streptococcaceae bacterium]
MKKIIIYASKYGSSTKYAAEIGKALDYPVYSYQDKQLSSTITDAGEIIFVAAVHISKPIALKKLVELCPPNMNVTFVAVGLNDYNLAEKRTPVEESITKEFAANNIKVNNIYYLRGSLDMKRMSLLEKTMFKKFYKDAKGKSDNQKNDGDQFILEAYENPDFSDVKGLENIIQQIKTDSAS